MSLIEEMQKRVNLSLRLGWTISTGMLIPPNHFECKKWAVIWEPHYLTQGMIAIPHWFKDDYVMTTGSWE